MGFGIWHWHCGIGISIRLGLGLRIGIRLALGVDSIILPLAIAIDFAFNIHTVSRVRCLAFVNNWIGAWINLIDCILSSRTSSLQTLLFILFVSCFFDSSGGRRVCSATHYVEHLLEMTECEHSAAKPVNSQART